MLKKHRKRFIDYLNQHPSEKRFWQITYEDKQNLFYKINGKNVDDLPTVDRSEDSFSPEIDPEAAAEESDGEGKEEEGDNENSEDEGEDNSSDDYCSAEDDPAPNTNDVEMEDIALRSSATA